MTRLKSSLLVFPLIIAMPSARVLAQNNALSLRHVKPVHIEQFGYYNALSEMATKAKIQIGVEYEQESKERPIKFDFSGGTAGEFMNAFIQQAPDFSWEESNGFLHVTLRGRHLDIGNVSITIPEALSKSRKDIWDDLATTPEIKTSLVESGCIRQEFMDGSEFRDNNKPIKLEPGSRTLRQLLDETASKSGENFWLILKSPPQQKPCSIAIWLW
jgi:hypothetical protein